MARPSSNPDLTRQVLDLCTSAGFERSGVATVEPSRYTRELQDWLNTGKQGSMAWLAKHTHVRTDPARLLKGTRAIVMVAMPYASRGVVDPPPEASSAPRGRIARYARGRDYHRAMKKRLHAICDALRALHPDHQFRAFADIEPMPERELAARAGLGWTAKHTLLINPRLGSWITLGGFSTTLPLAPPPDQPISTDHCGTCTRCIDACPTRAITPYSVDASRCISYLTIERRLPIDPALHAPIGGWLFGCDICQEVCPHNSPRPGTTLPTLDSPIASSPTPAPDRATLPLLDILDWTPADRTAALSASVIKRATLVTLKRNAIIVLANHIARSPNPAILARLRAIAHNPDEAELLRITARQSLDRLGEPA